MVQDMAMKSPDPRIVGVENHFDGRFRRYYHGVAQCALDFSPINLRYLDIVTMQMHRMSHPRIVPEYDFDPLAFLDIKTVSVRVSRSVNRPTIFRHVAAQDTGQRAVHGLFGQWIPGLQSKL